MTNKHDYLPFECFDFGAIPNLLYEGPTHFGHKASQRRERRRIRAAQDAAFGEALENAYVNTLYKMAKAAMEWRTLKLLAAPERPLQRVAFQMLRGGRFVIFDDYSHVGLTSTGKCAIVSPS
ncbi:hypothetical protein RZS28_06310 [Methylocapsa polymorpha]|uniref:Uncharacterized protein n=1 Tax=Methylocapsa polymorpha TaxID=3080828 RepID=A0ABZ0HUE6_9HYPH|nr:hypothetical protein RZS28_06310 [Methylocapsa sp. RX1]